MTTKKKVLLFVLGSAIAVAAVPVVGFYLKARRDEDAFQEQLRLARSEGLPTTAKEFAATIEPAKPEENAAPLYRRLKGKLRDSSDAYGMSIRFAHRPDAQLMAESKRYLARHQDVIETVEAAAKLPKCWFDRDWTDGMAVLLPEFADMKGAARIVMLRACIAAEERRVDDAIRDTRLVRKIAHHARQEPTAIAQLVSESIDLYAMRRLADWSFHFRDPRYAKELGAVIAARPEPDPKKESRDNLFGILTLVELSQSAEGREKLGLREEDMPKEIERVFSLILDKGKAKADLVRWQRAWWKAIDAPKPERLAKMDEATHETYKALLAFPVAARLLEALSSGPVPVAYRREQWRANQIRYQAALRALSSPAIPKSIRTDDLLSPFDGKPVSYRFDGKQIVIEVSIPEDLEINAAPLKIPPDPPADQR